MAQQATLEARSSRMVPILFLLSLLVVAGVFFMARFLISESRIDAGHLFGGQVPSRLKTLMALRLEDGELAEFFDAGNQHKVSLVIATGVAGIPAGVSAPDVMTALDKNRTGQQGDSVLAPVILKYGNAQINTLSTSNISSIELQVHGRAVQAQKFEAPKQARYLMGVLNLNNAQLFYLFLKKGEPVDPVYAGQILSEMPLVQAAVKLLPGT